MKHASIHAYHEALSEDDRRICTELMRVIDECPPQAESRIWHGHPVWFFEGNPNVGYDRLKGCIRLMFWSGADFGEPQLKPGTGKFKDASIRYTCVEQIDESDLRRWLEKSLKIQWDYRNLRKRKGKLERLK